MKYFVNWILLNTHVRFENTQPCLNYGCKFPDPDPLVLNCTNEECGWVTVGVASLKKTQWVLFEIYRHFGYLFTLFYSQV